MSTNLPIKKEKGLFNKIKNFFKRLFYREEHNTEEKIVEDKIAIIEEDMFKENIKVNNIESDLQKRIARDRMFNNIRKKPELLDTLTNEQLETIDKYYDKVIESNKKIIREKKELINKLKKVS